LRIRKVRRPYFILLMTLLNGLCLGDTEVSQWGITVKFADDETVGQFVNGDYYVVGQVSIVNVDPCCSSTRDDEQIRNGAMIDPNAGGDGSENVATTAHGFDSRISGWDATLNVALPGDANITSENPLVIDPNASLVIGKSDSTENMTDYMILTVLDKAPAANSFRPAYAEHPDKTIQYTIADVNYDALADLDPCGTEPSWDDANSWFQYPNICISTSNPGAAIAGDRHSVHDDFAWRLYKVLLKCNSDYTDAQKRDALIHVCQNGIDIWGIMNENAGGRGQFFQFGAFNLGKKLCVIATAQILGDTTMMNTIQTKMGEYGYSNKGDDTWPTLTVPSDYIHNNEDDGVFYLADWDTLDTPYTVYYTYDVWEAAGTVKVEDGNQYVIGTDCNFFDAKQAGFEAWTDAGDCDNQNCNSEGYRHQLGTWFVVDDEVVTDTEFTPYAVADFNSTTFLTLDRAYEGDSNDAATYKLCRSAFYGHGAKRNSNWPNCYRAIDYNEPTSDLHNWPVLGLQYLGGAGYDPSPWKLDTQYDGCNDYGGYYGNNGAYFGGQALVVLIMGLKTEWNNDAFFDFADRWVTIEAPTQGGSAFAGTYEEDMWEEYRGDYGDLWTEPSEEGESTTYVLGIYQ